MPVWTISAEEGTCGAQAAAELAAAAAVPLYDRGALSAVAREAEPGLTEADALEARLGGGLGAVALSLAMIAGSTHAYHELRLRNALPSLGTAVLSEAARHPAVILAPGAFAALGGHCSAIHVRLRAPLECRIAAFQREHVVDRQAAERAVKHDDHAKRAWVKTLYHVDIDDPRRFALVVDTSRLPVCRIVDLLLAAAGVEQPAPVA
jgi:Cytidylate kinase-like family